MEVYESYGKDNPQKTKNPISNLFVNWARRYIVISKSIPWQQDMHYPLLDEDRVQAVKPEMVKQFDQYQSFLWAMLAAQRCEFLVIFIIILVETVSLFSIAIFLSGIVRAIEGNPDAI